MYRIDNVNTRGGASGARAALRPGGTGSEVDRGDGGAHDAPAPGGGGSLRRGTLRRGDPIPRWFLH